MPERKQPKQVTLQARVDEGMAQRAEIVASIQGLSVSQMLRDALDEYMQRAILDEDAIAALERAHQEKLDALAKLREWQSQRIRIPGAIEL